MKGSSSQPDQWTFQNAKSTCLVAHMSKGLFPILILALIYGCHIKEPTEPVVEYTPLIPLSVGNYWLHQAYLLDPDSGTVTAMPVKRKFGFVIHRPPSQTMSNGDLICYQMSRCDSSLLPIDDTLYTSYGGSKTVKQERNGFHYSSGTYWEFNFDEPIPNQVPFR
jgi:hypothetical protein